MDTDEDVAVPACQIEDVAVPACQTQQIIEHISDQTTKDEIDAEASNSFDQDKKVLDGDKKVCDADGDKKVLDDFGKAFHSSINETTDSLQAQSGDHSGDQSGEHSGDQAQPISNAIPQDVYHVKNIDTIGGSFSIVLQSENGPCPLIAVFNTLQLQGKIAKITKPRIKATELCSLFGNFLLDLAQQRSDNVEHIEHYIVDCLERFGKIQTGVDVNVRFNSVTGFEYTADLAMFDMAGVRLLHGWLIDPQDTVLAELVGDLTYNQLVEVAMSKCDSEATQEMSESLILQEHLATTQLTIYGLCELHQVLTQNESCVLFRNNHFNTLMKHNDMLYVLVSDVGWENHPCVVWETLENTDNSTTFVDGAFRRSSTGSDDPTNSPQSRMPEYKGDDEAYAMALQLQHLDIPEEEKLEQQRIWEETKAKDRDREETPGNSSGSSKKKDPSSSRTDKKKDPPSRTDSVKSDRSFCSVQ